MIQDGDRDQTSPMNLSMTASYEAKGGGCYREVTVMGGTGVTRHLFFAKVTRGIFWNCLAFVQRINVLARAYLVYLYWLPKHTITGSSKMAITTMNTTHACPYKSSGLTSPNETTTYQTQSEKSHGTRAALSRWWITHILWRQHTIHSYKKFQAIFLDYPNSCVRKEFIGDWLKY